MGEYDWEAMARRIEEGRAPKPLAEMLKAIYELGVAHGSGCSEGEMERLGAALREASRT